MKQWIIFCILCFVMLKCTEEILEDTTPPIVNITYPHNSEWFYLFDTLDIKVEASDNVAVIRVNFHVSRDEGLYWTKIIDWDDYAEPYIYEKWIPFYHARHKIRATAYDSSNNWNEDIIIIEVLGH